MIIGSIYMYGGSVPPQGFLMCDGSPVSRTTYSDLFDLIGTSYGTGDGATTFNVPDLSGRVILGASSTYTMGSSGGEEDHVLLDNEIPSHAHSIPQHGHLNDIVATTPKLTHTVTQPAYNYNRPNGTRAMGVSTTQVVAYNGTTSTNATRTADIKMSNHTAAACTMSGGISDCAAFDTEPDGGSVGHSNMQPFVTLNYIIYTGV